MSRYTCAKPEWSENWPCPIDTGELSACAECVWAKEDENNAE